MAMKKSDLTRQESDLYILAYQRVKHLENNELLCFIRSRDALVRDMIIREFHVRPDREVFGIAEKLIRDKQLLSREAGYLILGQLGSPDRPFLNDSMPLIMHGLRTEKSVYVQCAIACAIGHLVPPEEFNEEIIDVFCIISIAGGIYCKRLLLLR